MLHHSHAAARDRGGMLVGWGALRGRERGAPSRAPAPQRRGPCVALFLDDKENLQSARWALFGRRRSGSSGNGTGSSRRSSRGQPTQESILGPISMTIYINMNDGDSDAMDNRR